MLSSTVLSLNSPMARLPSKKAWQMDSGNYLLLLSLSSTPTSSDGCSSCTQSPILPITSLILKLSFLFYLSTSKTLSSHSSPTQLVESPRIEPTPNTLVPQLQDNFLQNLWVFSLWGICSQWHRHLLFHQWWQNTYNKIGVSVKDRVQLFRSSVVHFWCSYLWLRYICWPWTSTTEKIKNWGIVLDILVDSTYLRPVCEWSAFYLPMVLEAS